MAKLKLCIQWALSVALFFFIEWILKCLTSTATNRMSYMIHEHMCKDLLCDLQECCDCCSLGLQFRSEGHRCESHRYLGFHCRHVFLTCCEGEESRAGNQDDWHSTVRERPALTSSPPPQKGRPTARKYSYTNVPTSNAPCQERGCCWIGVCNTHWCTARVLI